MNKTMIIPAVLIAAMLSGCATPKGNDASKKRTYARKMRDDTLAELYENRPETKEKIEKSVGYGVFSNININLFLLSAGNGYGIVHSKSTNKDTFMKMGLLGIGPGLGIKDFRALIIYKDEEAMDSFIDDGWEWGGHADAALIIEDSGGEVSGSAEVTGDMEIYVFTENGIALQATISGTKYWKDQELN